jgi:hypothetical protein
MLLTGLGFGLLAFLIIAALPLPKVRQAILAFAARAGQAGLVAAVAACGTFFVRPDSVPSTFTPYSSKLIADVHRFIPEIVDALPGTPFLILAAILVALSLPVLALVEFAARIMGHTAMIKAFRKEVRAAADALDRRLAGMTALPSPELTTELEAAANALRTATGEPRTPRTGPPKLVRDLL